MNELIERIEHLFNRHGGVHYGPEPVTLIQHSMQCAEAMRAITADDNQIVAAGLHDIGHLLVLEDGQHYAGGGDAHESIGAEMLAPYLPGAVVEPIRWHVEAKRYLVATDPVYESQLSPGSIASLEQQGGPMSEAEAQTFRSTAAFDTAVRLRRLDEGAKNPAAPGMPFTDFLAYVERVTSRRL
jgi:[1-hydroxy-2-(trimethylamino)ethyl]phosphonate dioxygenase